MPDRDNAADLLLASIGPRTSSSFTPHCESPARRPGSSGHEEERAEEDHEVEIGDRQHDRRGQDLDQDRVVETASIGRRCPRPPLSQPPNHASRRSRRLLLAELRAVDAEGLARDRAIGTDIDDPARCDHEGNVPRARPPRPAALLRQPTKTGTEVTTRRFVSARLAPPTEREMLACSPAEPCERCVRCFHLHSVRRAFADVGKDVKRQALPPSDRRC